MSEAWAALTPELACADLETSLAFYVDRLGFAVRIRRPGFAYLALGRAELMLESADAAWWTATAERPWGRGINLQIEVADVTALVDRLAGWALFRPVAENWYRDGDICHGQREFLVQDPDGYLLRFAQVLGLRAAGPGDS